MKVTILRGLPASGKSTYALNLIEKFNGKIKRINKDSLRSMIDAGVYSKSNEVLINKAKWGLLKLFIQDGKDIILDDTHLRDKDIIDLMNALHSFSNEFNCSIDVEIKTIECPVSVAIARDNLRGSQSVGEEVINAMSELVQLIHDNTYTIIPVSCRDGVDCALPKCLIINLDSVLINNYTEFDPNVLKMINSFGADKKLCFLTFETESFKLGERTGVLIKNKFDYKNLVYGSIGSSKLDHSINNAKKETYLYDFLNVVDVCLVIDNDAGAVNVWNSVGLFCVQTVKTEVK